MLVAAQLITTSFAGAPVGAEAPDFYHSGTPPGITRSFDCAARKAAFTFGQTLLPARGSFKTLFQALQLQACNMTTPEAMDEYQPPSYAAPEGVALYVDYAKGDDASGAGTLEQPLRTIAAAVAKAAGTKDATVLLRGGTHYTPQTVEIGPEHSGLTIQNYAGERAVVSGAVPLSIPASAWTPHKIGSGPRAGRRGTELASGIDFLLR